jgi:hypothetical protein
MYLGRLAHQVVVMDTLGTLACPDVGQDLGQSAVNAGIDESGAMCVVFGTAHGDGRGVAIGVIVKGTVRYAAVRDVRCHELPP